jgi:hypothetical protein
MFNVSNWGKREQFICNITQIHKHLHKLLYGIEPKGKSIYAGSITHQQSQCKQF